MSAPTTLLFADPETERLVARARRGQRSARRKLHRRLRTALYPLAYAWTGHPWSATRAIRAAINAGLADGTRPYGTAVVAALHRHTSRLRDGQHITERNSTLRRAVLVLCDGNRLSRSAAASLLGLPAAAVAEHHRLGRAALGLAAADSDVPRCAGWPLVSRDDAGLTPAERAAVQGHLRLCRKCRDGLAARRRTRTALQATGALGGGGAAAAAAVAIEGLLASAGTATVAGGIGVVGGLGIVGGINGGHLPAHLPLSGHRGPHDVPTSVKRSAPSTSPAPAAHATAARTPAAGQSHTSARPTPTATTTPLSSPSPDPGSSDDTGDRSITLPSLPPVTLPGVTLPSVPGLPSVSVPPVTLPTVALPPVAVPPVNLPLPSVSLPHLSRNGLSPTALTIPLPTISLPTHSSH